MRVLILGGRAPVALDHARRFHSQGWTAYIADSVSCRVSGWSRTVAATFRLPPPRRALSAFAKELARVIEAQRIDLVLPTCEEVFYLSRIRDRLPSACNVFVAPFELLRELHSKWQFLSLATQAGVQVPQSDRVNDLPAARDWAGRRAVVLKLEFSRFGVHVRIYPNGIPADAAPLPSLAPWIVQSFEPGREVCSYSIAIAGRLAAHVAYIPSYRMGRSSAYYFQPIDAPELIQLVREFVAHIGFTGQISFDWIRSDSGEWTALECNPRAISGVHLFEASQPLPAIIAGLSTLELLPREPTPRMLAAVMLSVGLASALRQRALTRWYRDWRRATDVLAEPGDCAPFLGALCDIGSFAGVAIRNRCSLRAASTRDIEWDGEPLHDS